MLKKNIRESLVDNLAKKLNDGIKGKKVAYFLDDEFAPTNVVSWLSTGNSILDFAISNKKNGGIPTGRITEISGLEGAGKSLIAAHIIKDTQRQGGIGVFIDTEASVARDFFKAVGIDLDNMIYAEIEELEDIYNVIEKIISDIRSKESDRLVTIVFDSISAATPKEELEETHDKSGYGTLKARINSASLKRITNLIARQNIALVITSQLRTRIGTSFGDPYISASGGMALQFYSSIRIRLYASTKIKSNEKEVEEIIGVRVKAKVVKNRLGPPHRKADFDIYFDSGVDDYNSWLLMLKDYKIISVTGGWNKVVNQNGEEIKFRTKEWAKMIHDDKSFRDYIYDIMAEKLIMKYRDISEVDIDKISYGDDEEEVDMMDED